MKKLAKEAADKMPFVKQGQKTSLCGLLLTLETGEAIMLKHEAWKAQRLPYDMNLRLMKTPGCALSMAACLSGWIIKN